MTEQKTLSSQAWLELLLLGLIWGASFMTIRIALDEVSVLSSVVHRVGWAAIALWVIVWLRGLKIPTNPMVWFAFIGMGILNNVLPFSLMAWGQLHIESGLTSILNAVTAIFGVLVAALFFADERLTAMRLLGVGLGFAGVVSVIGPGALTGFDLRSTAQIAVLAGTLSYAFAGAWGRWRLGGLSPVVAAAGMLTASLVIMLPLTLLREGNIDLPTTPRGMLAIAYYALIATAGAYLLYYRVLARAGAGNLMLVTLIIPPIAIALGAWVLNEALNPNAYLGFGLLALGLMVINFSGRRRNITGAST
ncbi:DMT family transporter [Actibacterium sp. 188UL27-1]|uniref:DMT family transporter n=1 Tax=Actibacterium sp. 188UL27-1 TaxID=2786961 RepID=UPI00195E2E32|nr:DMT family transporter [Actibacterium sp. 188UL27-1]MBM7068478.1 DMT family transporter [Actibacterium sp. 188UL27-1]